MRLSFHNGEVHVPLNPMFIRGVGATPSTASTVASVESAAMQGYAGAKSSGSPAIGAAITGTSLAATIMLFSSAAGPFAPFVALAAGLIGPIASMFKGCGSTCIEATKIADASESAANQLFDAWNAQPVHYYSVQQAYLAAINDVQKYLFGACSSQTLGAAGQRCVSERQRGGKYDFFSHYVDPVANATNIVPDPVTPGSPSAIISSIPTPLLLGGAALGLYLLMGNN